MKKYQIISTLVIAIIIVVAALSIYALQRFQAEVDTTEWQASHNDDFNLTISHPQNCTLSFMAETPGDEEKTVFTLDCGSAKPISVGYIYRNLLDSYIAERRQSNRIVRELDASGHTLLQLSLDDTAQNKPSLVTYITDKESDLSLEVYGPVMNESESGALYNKIVDSIQFN